MTTHDIADNLLLVEKQICEACALAKRRRDEVSLICASKMVSVDDIRQAYEAGARDFGENYGQELRDKARALAELKDLRWHFIGGLQRNKLKYVVGTAVLIHSVDNIGLLEEIDKRAQNLGIKQDVLIELNLAAELSKWGAEETALSQLLAHFAYCPSTTCRGLMTMPPYFDDPTAAKPFFARLRELRDQSVGQYSNNVQLEHLSMGMSGDFSAAIAQGATMIRIGTSIFGPRQAM